LIPVALSPSLPLYISEFLMRDYLICSVLKHVLI
jgi:hypothetical protein